MVVNNIDVRITYLGIPATGCQFHSSNVEREIPFSFSAEIYLPRYLFCEKLSNEIFSEFIVFPKIITVKLKFGSLALIGAGNSRKWEILSAKFYTLGYLLESIRYSVYEYVDCRAYEKIP